MILSKIVVTGTANFYDEQGITHYIPVIIEYGWNDATENLYIKRITRVDNGARVR